MPSETQVLSKTGRPSKGAAPVAEPCLLVIFGAAGDLTKRLLMPALYNLACDGLLPSRFAILGTAMEQLDTEQFRAKMSTDIRQFSTRHEFDAPAWDALVSKFHYLPARFDDDKA